MSRKPDPQIVAALAAVTDYDKAVIDDLAQYGQRVNIPERWSVLFEKTSADMAYILLDGQVEVRKGGDTIATLEPGALFGEMALIDHTLRNASVVAVSPISALRLDHDSLSQVIDSHPAWGEKVRSQAESHR